MNFGDCPYEGCDGRFWEAVPDRTPAWARLTCETCHRLVWYKFSRIDPEALTPEEFDAEYIVDEETKSVRERNPPSPEVKAFIDLLAKAFATRYDHVTAYGMEHSCKECRTIPS